MSVETEPVEIPDHVTVTPLRAAFTVECAECRRVEFLYFTVAMRDPSAVRVAVERHAGCALASGSREGTPREPSKNPGELPSGSPSLASPDRVG